MIAMLSSESTLKAGPLGLGIPISSCLFFTSIRVTVFLYFFQTKFSPLLENLATNGTLAFHHKPLLLEKIHLLSSMFSVETSFIGLTWVT